MVLNGAPGCGKDTIANMLKKRVYELQNVKFAEPLGKMLAAMIGVEYESEEYYLWREDKKDVIHPMLGMTPRQFLIYMSEEVVKLKFGRDYFGKIAGNVVNSTDKPIVVTDCGFQYEYEAFKQSLSGDNDIRLVRVLRDGCDYENDSREYVVDKDPVIDSIFINDYDDLHGLENGVECMLLSFF